MIISCSSLTRIIMRCRNYERRFRIVRERMSFNPFYAVAGVALVIASLFVCIRLIRSAAPAQAH